MLKLILENALKKEELEQYKDRVVAINKAINEKTLPGNDYLGWAKYPLTYDKQEAEQIKKDAEYVRNHFDILVVCGIGGSYLGARAAIEALNGIKSTSKPEIIFFGQTFSPNYTAQVLEYLKDKRFAINVISKSGTTTETSIAFRLVKELLEKQIGKDASRKAIFATTDKEKGALLTLAKKEGYQTYVLPSDIGGRYSVFSAVGLFPLACAGVDIDDFMKGAYDAMATFDNDDLYQNICYQYACSRDYFYRKAKKSCELFVTYEPQFTQIGEWLKQLFGESEGKMKKGLFPTSATFSTDLHSLGQFIQDGSPVLFETIIYVEKPNYDVLVPHDDLDLDGLNYLENKSLSFVNRKASEGTLQAHTQEGKVPCIVLELDSMNPYNLGYLFYFFMRACAMSAYLLEINPFNQPGVEVYKRNMFHLLGKKGY